MQARGVPPSYLALGDSYTIGEGVDPAARWPEQLAARLRQHSIAIAPPRILATTGWSTDELEAAMDRADLGGDYALVSLLIGVNDQYRGRHAGSYRPRVARLLRRAVALAGGQASHVVVVSIPDWGVTRFAREQGRDAIRIGRELDDYNAIARDEAWRVGARFVDITTISRRHGRLTVEDGLHPDGRQYALWTQAIEPVARAGLHR